MVPKASIWGCYQDKGEGKETINVHCKEPCDCALTEDRVQGNGLQVQMSGTKELEVWF